MVGATKALIIELIAMAMQHSTSRNSPDEPDMIYWYRGIDYSLVYEVQGISSIFLFFGKPFLGCAVN